MLISAIFGVVVITAANGFRNCEDCTELNDCPQALYEVTNNYSKVEKKLKEAYCKPKSGNFMICCSDFNNISGESANEPAIENKDEIESHPNLHLLSEECGVIEEYRIIGGETALLYEFPWLVLIFHRKMGKLEFYCGGTLINTRYVLSAAHCIKNHVIAGVRVGEYDISKKVDCYGGPKWRQCESRIQDIAVKHKFVHPGFRENPEVINDIGLLRLRKQVNFSARNAAAICLPVYQKLREKSLSGDIGVVAGWGMTRTGEPSNILLKVDIPIHSIKTCKTTFKRTNMKFKNILCAGESGADSCKGDSGGPLMLEDEYNNTYRNIQYGIVSNGYGCGNGIPAIYTDVRKFMKWILDTIKR